MIERLTGLTFAIVTVGLVFPYGFPVVAPLVVACLGLAAAQSLASDRRLHLERELAIVYAAMFAFLLIGMARSTTLYDHVRADFIIAVTGLMIIPVVCRIRALGTFDRFRDAFAAFVFVLGTVAAVAGLYKFVALIRGAPMPWFVLPMDSGRFPLGTALQADYNMAALGLIVSGIAGFHLLARQRSLRIRTAIVGAMLLIIACALLTGSRRFYVVFGAFAISAVVMLTYLTARAFIRLALRNPIRSGTALQIAVIIGLVAVSVRLAVGQFPSFIESDIAGQFDRLLLRLSTLLDFLETLEGSRGEWFARSIELIGTFGPIEYLLGSGFAYLHALARDGTEVYPHNPWLSAFLYGGILNVLLLTYVLIRSAWIYAANWRLEPFLSASFFVTFAFISVSGNTIFSSRLFLFLILLGFLLPAAHGARAEPKPRKLRSFHPAS